MSYSSQKAPPPKSSKVITAEKYLDAMEKAMMDGKALDSHEIATLAQMRARLAKVDKEEAQAQAEIEERHRKNIEDDLGIRGNALKGLGNKTVKFVEFVFLEKGTEVELEVISPTAFVRMLPYMSSDKMREHFEMPDYLEHYSRTGHNHLLQNYEEKFYSLGITRDYIKYLFREYLKTFLKA